jgi:sphingolipid delta-4 desaturase
LTTTIATPQNPGAVFDPAPRVPAGAEPAGLSAARKREFIYVDYPEPHIGRTRKIVAAHPEVKELFGNHVPTFFYAVGIVAAQLAVAYLLRDSAWWVILAVSFAFGAFCNHALFVLIHEATHNLILKGSVGNRVTGLICNIPITFPAAMGFRKFHLLHHRHQGEFELDADLAGPMEARVIGNGPIRKSLWFLFFFFVEGVVRPRRLKTVQLMDRWVALNAVTWLATTGAIVHFTGWSGFAYLFASTLFSIGLHPLGARWIQEHYVVKANQETYSYYGRLNAVTFNVGYHNEHHDLMMVPWRNLPKLRKMAPEFYDDLHAHRSWTKLFFRFIFDKDLSLYSRVVRESKQARAARTS